MGRTGFGLPTLALPSTPFLQVCARTCLALQLPTLTLCGQINPSVSTKLPPGQASAKGSELALAVEDRVSGELSSAMCLDSASILFFLLAAEAAKLKSVFPRLPCT